MQRDGVKEFGRIRLLFEKAAEGVCLYDERDWERLEFASALAVGNSVIDVGTGPGVLVYCLAETERFGEAIAFDIATHSHLLHHHKVTYRTADLRSTSFDAARSDTVFCMEVIEHIDELHNSVVLKTLRRLTASRLVVTVPFAEPEPLWWHDRPGGHRQRFTLEKAGWLFPNALATLQPRWGVDWLFLVEDDRLALPYFQLVTKARFVELLRRS